MQRKRTRVGRALLLCSIGLGGGGCNRYYTASTDFNLAAGLADCKALCGSWGMEMLGIVTMHDSNSGCICRPLAKSEPGGAAPDGGAG